MKIAIISDIHSNIEALSVTRDWLDRNGITDVLCLGDVVGYGADPNACCDMIRANDWITLMGNHDAAVTGMMDTEYYYPAARDAIKWTHEQLSATNFQWLYGLPYTYVLERAGFYHSAPIRPSGFYYVVQTRDAQAHSAIFPQLKDWSFLGHSHLTQQYALTADGVTDVSGTELCGLEGTKHIVNVGSVGQPRDRDNRLCFGLFDTEEDAFCHVRLEYDITSAAKKIEQAGLDQKFAKRLFAGQ